MPTTCVTSTDGCCRTCRVVMVGAVGDATLVANAYEDVNQFAGEDATTKEVIVRNILFLTACKNPCPPVGGGKKKAKKKAKAKKKKAKKKTFKK